MNKKEINKFLGDFNWTSALYARQRTGERNNFLYISDLEANLVEFFKSEGKTLIFSAEAINGQFARAFKPAAFKTKTDTLPISPEMVRLRRTPSIFSFDVNPRFGFRTVRGSDQMDSNHDLFTYAGQTVEFLPTDFNKTLLFAFKKEVSLPAWYSMPFPEFPDDYFETEAGIHKDVKKTLFKGDIQHDGKANLALILEKDSFVNFYFLSGAGFSFTLEILWECFPDLKEKFEAFLSDRSFREIVNKLTKGKRRSIETAKADIDLLRRDLVSSHRALKIAESDLRKIDPNQMVKNLFSSVCVEAKKFSDIKAIGCDSEGNFEAVVGPVSFTAWYTEDEEFYFEPPSRSGKKATCNLGYLLIKLRHDPYIYALNGESLRHPHVYADGKMCLGSGDHLYQAGIGEIKLVDSIRFVIHLLEKYNPESPVDHLEDLADFNDLCREDDLKSFNLNWKHLIYCVPNLNIETDKMVVSKKAIEPSGLSGLSALVAEAARITDEF